MGMKVTLNIQDDQQLRAAIQDSIKGEVTSIARGEIKGIIAQVVGEKVVPKTPKELDALVRETVAKQVQEVAYSRGGGWSGPRFIQNVIQETAEKIIREELGLVHETEETEL